MATADVLKPQPKTTFGHSVKGYRPEGMDTPSGQVLVTGPRRPAGGYAANTPTKAPGAIVKQHVAPRSEIPAVLRRSPPRRVAPTDRLGRPGRIIIPNNGISLPNTNRV